MVETDICLYKNIFGEPKKGAHKYRILNLAIVDIGFTVLAGYLISLYTKININIILVILFLLGIIFHRLFCVETTIDKLIFF